MAVSSTARGKATLALAAGASYLLIALWDLSDKTFGSSSAGSLSRVISIWLFDTFGHWGPRVALITIGLLFVALSFKLASLAREDEAASEAALAYASAHQRRGTSVFAILSWTLVLLLLSLLASITVGPLLRNPAIDSVLTYWRVNYYTTATALTVISVLGFWLWLDWKEFRETGDPWKLRSILLFLVAAIVLGVLFALDAIFGPRD